MRRLKIWPAGYRKIKATIAVSLVFVLAILLFWHFLNSPSEGKIEKAGEAHPSAPPAVKSGSFSDQYISFNFPEGYYKSNNPSLSPGYVDAVRIFSQKHAQRYIAVTIIKEPLTSDAGLNYRLQHPDIYKVQPTNSYGRAFTTINQGFESDVYISRGDYVLTVVAVDSSGQDTTGDQNSLLASLQWR